MMKRNYMKKMLAAVLSASVAFSGVMPAMASTGTVDATALEGSRVVAKQIEAEGMVLLKNNNSALPLQSTEKVNVFGTSSLDPFLGGGGSGAISVDNEDNLIDFYEGLAGAGISYNPDLYTIYDAWYEVNKTDESFAGEGGAFGQFGSRPTHSEMPITELTEEQMSEMKTYSDTAVIVLGRCGTESADLTEEVLKLSAIEKAMVDKVANTFSKVVVLFNIDNIMEMGFLDEYPSIQAAAIIWAPGEVGMESVGKMLSGEVNPSGKLADTIAKHISDHPSNMNFGKYSYANNAGTFVEYEEGIYVGYRYFETFKDAKDDVMYPFGYGLSYTDFDWTVDSIDATDDTVTANVTVQNTGDRAGKDVVEVYFSAPYTGKIEKSAIELAGYAKTKELQPNESQTVTVTFDTEDMASYDMSRAAWVMESGNYKIKVARDVRTVEESKTYRVDQEKVIKNDDTTGTEITNLFSDADYGLTILSREDAESTSPDSPEAEGNVVPVDFSQYEKVTVDTTLTEIPKIGQEYEEGVVTLSDVYNADRNNSWNSPLWDKFLDQFTLDEMIELSYKGGFRTVGVERLGVPETVDNDGPAAIKGPGAGSYKESGIAYPVATTLACTYNDDLAEAMGQAVGEEAKAIGTNVWYAPGINIHRSPRGGRNFEYYSEDPFLSGKMAAALTRGAQSKGLIVTLKHMAVNDQEQGRERLYTWLNEQSMREIYLEPFEIGVKEGNALGIMSSFNRIGATWAGGSKALLTDLLRNEWGFKGFVVSDYTQNWSGTTEGYFGHAIAIYAGNDTILSPNFMDGWLYPGVNTKLKTYYENDSAGFGTALRNLTKNLCYMKMHTLAFTPEDIVGVNSTGTYEMVVEGFDWGPGVTKIIVSLDKTIDADSVSADKFQVAVEKQSFWGNAAANRTITDAYVSDAAGTKASDNSSYITLEMSVNPAVDAGSPFFYNFMQGVNVWATPYNNIITLTEGSILSTEGEYVTSLEIDPVAAGKIMPQADQFTEDTYTSGDTTLSYASYAPAEDNKKNPLIIWLHGAGEGGTDTDIALLGNKVTNLASNDTQQYFDGAYVLVPQSPTMWMDDGTGAYTSDGTSKYLEPLMDLIQSYVDNNADIDANRVYIGGCSNGGYMTMNVILHYPEYFAAAYPICEAYSDAWITDEMLEGVKDLPMWFTHAANDPTVNPTTHTVPTVERLKAMNAADLHFTYFDDVRDLSGQYDNYVYNGHWSWIYTLNNQCVDKGESIMEWMAKQAKTVPADLGKLEETLNSVPSVQELNGYTEESAAVVKSIQALAEDMAARKDLTEAEQALVDQITEALSKAIAGLSKVEVPVKADTTELGKAVAAVPEKLDVYTESTVKTLNAVLTAAKSLINRPDGVSQAVADDLAAAVKTAIANLSEKVADQAPADQTPADQTPTVKAPAKTAISKLKAGKKKVTVVWKKTANASGYQIYTSTKSSTKGFRKAATVKKASTSKVVLKKLKSGKRLYVKVRAYTVSNGNNLYGKFGKVKSIKVK